MQKLSGIIRKLDEVGRIVIPKEIRDYLRLDEGSPLQIGISENGEVILKNAKTTYISKDIIIKIINAFEIATKMKILVAINGIFEYGFDEIIGDKISASINQIIDNNRTYFACVKDKTTIVTISPKITDIKSQVLVGNKNKKKCVIGYSDEENMEIWQIKVIEALAEIIMGID